MNVLGLVQLCQAAQPVGGYGHFFGIEELVRRGRLLSLSDLEQLVDGVLDSAIAPADGIASGIAFRAARQNSFEQIPELCAALSSPRVPHDMQLASLQMGHRLWLISRDWNWAAAIHQEIDGLAGAADLHHAVAFGLLVSETTSSQLRAIATYLYNAAKHIILAAARAIPLEDAVALRVLSDVQPRITHLAARYADKSPADIAVHTDPLV